MEDGLFLGLTEKEIEEHTAQLSAIEVISTLSYFVNVIREKGNGYFSEKYLKPVLDNGTVIRDLNKLDAQKPLLIDQSLEAYATECTSFYIMVATVFAVDSIREYQAGRIQQASILAGYAERYLGAAIGSDSSCYLTKTVKTDIARKGGFKKAAQNIPIKTLCLEHYKAHILEYSSMNDAAEKLEKEFPMGFKAIRGWLTDFHKENPSIKKPHVDNKQSLSIYLLAEGIHALCLLC